jgi:hypothetical protein
MKVPHCCVHSFRSEDLTDDNSSSPDRLYIHSCTKPKGWWWGAAFSEILILNDERK